MFHWICPECGQEIAPGVKECPVCEPQASASSLPSGGHSITAAPVAAAPAPPVSSAPVAEQLAPLMKSPTPAAVQQTAPAVQQPVVQQFVGQQPIVEQPVQKPKAVLQPEIILRPEAILQAKKFHGPKPTVVLPVVLDAIPAEAPPVAMPDALLEPVSDAPPQPETFADRLADLADLLHGERIPYTAPRIFQESSAPGPRMEASAEKAPVVVDVTFHEDVTPNGTPAPMLLAAPPSPLLLAEPQPPSIAPGIPIQAFDPCPAVFAVRSQEPIGADLVAESASASPVRLPEPPNRAVAPALAPLQDYSETADRLMRPVELGRKPLPPRRCRR